MSEELRVALARAADDFAGRGHHLVVRGSFVKPAVLVRHRLDRAPRDRAAVVMVSSSGTSAARVRRASVAFTRSRKVTPGSTTQSAVRDVDAEDPVEARDVDLFGPGAVGRAGSGRSARRSTS